jgi:hypothetical protein
VVRSRHIRCFSQLERERLRLSVAVDHQCHRCWFWTAEQPFQFRERFPARASAVHGNNRVTVVDSGCLRWPILDSPNGHGLWLWPDENLEAWIVQFLIRGVVPDGGGSSILSTPSARLLQFQMCQPEQVLQAAVFQLRQISLPSLELRLNQ